MRNHNLFIKMPYFLLIESGKKKLEARANYPNLRNIKEHDTITFMSGNKRVTVNVSKISVYDTVSSMLEAEPIEDLVPGSSFQEAKDIYNEIYPPEKVRKNNGMRVFSLVRL